MNKHIIKAQIDRVNSPPPPKKKSQLIGVLEGEKRQRSRGIFKDTNGSEFFKIDEKHQLLN